MIFDRFEPLQGAEWSVSVLTLQGLWGGATSAKGLAVWATSLSGSDIVAREEQELVGE